ncbi:ComEC/Rec2 family competence protein [Neomegalonema sp.]|uniref:ComEC/Rec2 family competence protein n=1 Tax=Neomegalonema sp. TaxID=2039713 RepID=UPI00260BDBD9|nr:ComEC/Rec2 family competence protein [Neomegalonema sp.]MDD2868600.1 ComEC/Rec2 family competence protein [Neomegalonema sp.]
MSAASEPRLLAGAFAHEAPQRPPIRATERRRLTLWAPVGLGIGILLWFAAPFEPPLWTAGASWFAFGVWVLARARGSLPLAILAGALLTLCLGWSAATIRARLVAAPILAHQGSFVLEGRVETKLFRSEGKRRLILDRLVFEKPPRAGVPERIQVGVPPDLEVQAGERVKMTAWLTPPGGPPMPGGYDYGQRVWFQGIGGVGSARAETILILPPRPEDLDAGARLSRWRTEVAMALVERLGARTGGVAAALSVGVRGLAPEEVEIALRDSGLAHLLSISGAHMAVMTALIFGAARTLLAAVPGLAARRPIRKWAALAALAAATVYLAASGADAPAQRAYVMSGTAMVAILLDRRAISFRSLAAASLILLMLRPESLLEPGFQMSFAATAALVAAFEAIPVGRIFAGSPDEGAARRWARRLVLALLGSVVMSLAAGLASGIYGAAYFNRVQLYNLPANLAAAPLSSLAVMPALALSAILAPFGLEAPALRALGWSLEALNRLAEFFAGLPGAAPILPSPAPWALGLATLGGLWLCLWRDRRLRLAGLAPLGLGLAFWGAAPRPDLLIDAEGRLLGLRGADGLLALSHDGRKSYEASAWLRREGDGASQEEAAARPGWLCADAGCEASAPEGWRVIVWSGKTAPEALTARCAPKTLLVTGEIWEGIEGGCLHLPAWRLRREGSQAVSFWPEGPVFASGRRVGRIWTRANPLEF